MCPIVQTVASHLRQIFPHIMFTPLISVIEIGDDRDVGCIFFSRKWFPHDFEFSGNSIYIDLKDPNCMIDIVNFVKKVTQNAN